MHTETDEDDPSQLSRGAVQRGLDQVADVLPAQGPLSVFVHHNTLHAFEDLPFDQAVIEAGEIYGCEPYLSE